MNFTPGPWVVTSTPGGWDGVKEKDFGAQICSLNLNNPNNAFLIAAAPDLYEALSDLLAALDAYVGWRNTAAHEPRETAAENKARAALAKAEGR